MGHVCPNDKLCVAMLHIMDAVIRMMSPEVSLHSRSKLEVRAGGNLGYLGAPPTQTHYKFVS
jgi:hypothetical protein